MQLFLVSYFNQETLKEFKCGIFDSHRKALEAIEVLIRKEKEYCGKDYPWLTLAGCRESYYVEECTLNTIDSSEWEEVE